MITIEIIRNNDSGSTITRLPGTVLTYETWTAAAQALKSMREAGIQGAVSNCNDVAVVFMNKGKRIGWLSRSVFQSFKSGQDLRTGMTKPDTFGYKQPENVL